MLFNGSVFENIANGLVGTKWEEETEGSQMQRVQEAAKLAFAHDFIEKLPEGYHTRIGERGGLLSGGQKQRIAIARSVISEPKILLLDEATSALDPHAEGIVQKALDSASENRTTVVIAHKLATIRNADNIVVMAHGRIVEQGRHEELVSRNGTYATLVKAQDLAPTNIENTHGVGGTSTSDETSKVEDDTLVLVQSLSRKMTAEAPQLVGLKDRDDYDVYEKKGVIHNIWKLLRGTPDIWLWFAVSTATCIAGGECSRRWTGIPESNSGLEGVGVSATLTDHHITRSGRQPWASYPAGKYHERLYFSKLCHSRKLHLFDVLYYVARHPCRLLYNGLVH